MSNPNRGQKPAGDAGTPRAGSAQSANMEDTVPKTVKLKVAVTIPAKLGAKRAIDEKEHVASRLLPYLLPADNTPEAFIAACNDMLATCGGIVGGASVVVVKSDGSESAPIVPRNDVIENKKTIPAGSLPVTFADLADLINSGLAAVHRNQIGAALTKQFDKNAGTGAAATAAPPAVDDLDDIA